MPGIRTWVLPFGGRRVSDRFQDSNQPGVLSPFPQLLPACLSPVGAGDKRHPSLLRIPYPRRESIEKGGQSSGMAAALAEDRREDARRKRHWCSPLGRILAALGTVADRTVWRYPRHCDMPGSPVQLHRADILPDTHPRTTAIVQQRPRLEPNVTAARFPFPSRKHTTSQSQNRLTSSISLCPVPRPELGEFSPWHPDLNLPLTLCGLCLWQRSMACLTPKCLTLHTMLRLVSRRSPSLKNRLSPAEETPIVGHPGPSLLYGYFTF